MLTRTAEGRTVIAAVVLLFSFVLVPAQTSPTKLEAGSSVERTIGTGQSHTYSITLGEKQYLQFVVEQHGIDVFVQVLAPSGKIMARIDSPNGSDGPEHGSILSLEGGTYTIIVAPLSSPGEDTPGAASGRYVIKTVELRDATEDELKIGMGSEYRKKKALALLNETIDSLPNIHQAQTRIRLKEQAAQLLWNTDEKRSTKLLTECIRDAQDYAAAIPLDAEDYYETFAWSQQIRMEAVQLLALHDPEAALELLLATRRTNAADGEHLPDANDESQFELSLAGQIALKNPQRAYELAEASLKSGYSQTLVFTIAQLRRSNEDLATKLSKSLANKLLADSLLESPNALEVMMQLLRSAMPQSQSQASGSAKSDSLFSKEDTRALVQKMLDEILHFKPKPTDPVSQQMSYVQMMLYTLKGGLPNLNLDEIVPGTTAALDKKIKELGFSSPYITQSGEWAKYDQMLSNESLDQAIESIGQAPDYMREQLVRNLIQKTVSSGNLSTAKSLVQANLKDPRERQRMLIDLERQAALADANKGDMDGALKHVAKLPTAVARAEVISEFASRIGKGQKAATALRLLETAKTLVSNSIRTETAEQMTALLKLAGAFAQYDSKRAITIVEPLIQQFNELAEAAKVLNGFGIDYFQNGELSLHDGNGLSSVATPLAESLGEISIVDFDKAKQVSEGVTLPEVKLSLYLGLVQQVIAPGEVSVQTNTAMYIRRRIED